MTDPTITNALVHGARDLPMLISRASTASPELAAKWTGKSLAASKTVWGVLAALVIAEAVRRFGLGWGEDTIAIVSGAVVLAATVALRYISDLPITGIFRPATTAEAIAKIEGTQA